MTICNSDGISLPIIDALALAFMLGLGVYIIALILFTGIFAYNYFSKGKDK